VANRLYFYILSVSYIKSRRFEHDTDLEPGFRKDGSQFDQLLDDGQAFDIGPMTARATAVSGHTPACLAYKVGDKLFMLDLGDSEDGFVAMRTDRDATPGACERSYVIRPISFSISAISGASLACVWSPPPRWASTSC
jgi:hypothetical protein